MSLLAALVAGVLGLLAGLALERFRRASTDRRWLLDRRHDDAVNFLAAANRCSREFRRPRPSPERVEIVHEAEVALFSTQITSSAEAIRLSELVWDALVDLNEAETQPKRQEANAAFVARVRDVTDQLRRELQEPQRRQWRWLPHRRRRDLGDPTSTAKARAATRTHRPAPTEVASSP